MKTYLLGQMTAALVVIVQVLWNTGTCEPTAVQQTLSEFFPEHTWQSGNTSFRRPIFLQVFNTFLPGIRSSETHLLGSFGNDQISSDQADSFSQRILCEFLGRVEKL